MPVPWKKKIKVSRREREKGDYDPEFWIRSLCQYARQFVHLTC